MTCFDDIPPHVVALEIATYLDYNDYFALFQVYKPLLNIVNTHSIASDNYVKKWLEMHQETIDKKHCPRIIYAAKRGKLNVVKWIYINYGYTRPSATAECALELAVIHGHLDIVKFLHSKGERSLHEYAMQMAASKGHLEIVKFLYEKGETYSPVPMDLAASNGHLEVLKWLHTAGGFACTPGGHAMGLAARCGHFDVIKWLHTNIKGLTCMPAAIYWAAEEGHVEVVKWLCEHRVKEIKSSICEAIKRATISGHLEIVNFLTHRGKSVLDTKSVFNTKSFYKNEFRIKE